jgi:hypothetical protein
MNAHLLRIEARGMRRIRLIDGLELIARQISQLLGVSLTTASSGSMGACARYGNSKPADKVREAARIAAAASPSLRAESAGRSARRRYSLIKSAELRFSA